MQFWWTVYTMIGIGVGLAAAYDGVAEYETRKQGLSSTATLISKWGRFVLWSTLWPVYIVTRGTRKFL